MYVIQKLHLQVQDFRIGNGTWEVAIPPSIDPASPTLGPQNSSVYLSRIKINAYVIIWSHNTILLFTSNISRYCGSWFIFTDPDHGFLSQSGTWSMSKQIFKGNNKMLGDFFSFQPKKFGKSILLFLSKKAFKKKWKSWKSRRTGGFL